MVSDTPRTDRDDRPYPSPEHAQHIRFEGNDCLVMHPEEYEALYEQSRQLERELAAVTAERDALVKERDSSYDEVVVPLMKDKERLDWLCDTHAGMKWQRLDLLVSRGAIDAELERSKEPND